MEGASKIGNLPVPAGAREALTGAAAGAAAIAAAVAIRAAHRATLNIHYATQGSEVMPPAAVPHDLETDHDTELVIDSPVREVDQEPLSLTDKARRIGERVILATDTIGTLSRGITKWRRHTAANKQAKKTALSSPSPQSQNVSTLSALPNYL